MNEYLSKSDQNSVHYISCQVVKRYLNFCSGCIRKGLGLGLAICGLGFGLEGPGLGPEG